MPQGVYVWSKTAATNSNADSSINWSEGQAPSSVNDSARATMARIAEWRDDNSGALHTTGTSTAYVVATNQQFASLVLMDQKSIVIIPHVTSGASPTINVDGLGSKPLRAATGAALAAGAFVLGTPYRITYLNATNEFLCDGAALADGDVSTANLADLSVTAAKIADATITAAKIAPGSIGGAAVAPSFVPFNTCMLNGTIVVTQGGGAMTFTIKTLAGADPSATDPVTFMFRDQSANLGDYVVRSVTAPLALLVPSGATLGFIGGQPGRVWLLALDNAGAVELAVFNATGLLAGTPVQVSNIYPLHCFGIISTTALGGASILSGVAYSQTARASKAYVPVGYASWEVGTAIVGVAGNWNVLPARLQIFQPGSSPLPGAIVQQAYSSTNAFATGTTIIGATTAVPQNTEGIQFLAANIAPNSSANVLFINAALNLANGGVSNHLVAALFQDATVNAIASTMEVAPATATIVRPVIDYQMQAGTVSSTTFKVRAGGTSAGATNLNAESGATALFGGTYLSSIRITEMMG